jgi:hypothetical protein
LHGGLPGGLLVLGALVAAREVKSILWLRPILLDMAMSRLIANEFEQAETSGRDAAMV